MPSLHRTSAGILADPERWRLNVNNGVHRWQYVDEQTSTQRPQSAAEKYFLGLPTESARNGFRFYQSLQLEDGHWGCAYGGPSFLLAGTVIAMYITETEISPEWKTEIIRYLTSTVNQDGGWGLHSAGDSTVFATSLYYITLRRLGLEPTHPLATKARTRLHTLGGAIGVPQWGKVWLALLNLYSWDGVDPIPPESWLLADWVPFHPWPWWVQCRVVYLPVLRHEIYISPYEKINFERYRDHVAPSDLKKPTSNLLRVANRILRFWEQYVQPDWIVQRANQRVCALTQREDENTSYNCLAPANKAFHMVAVWHSDGVDSPRMISHREKIPPYMWMGESGMTCSGTNGVQAWDTAFTIQAMVEAGLGRDSEFRSSLEKALQFLDVSQLRDNLEDPYRHPRKGGWPFSTKDNGYVVSDCAAEGLKAVLMLQKECNFPSLISDERLQSCVFDSIMVEYPYPECTTAVVTTLSLFHRHFPAYRAAEIEEVIRRACTYILSEQWPNGGWYGSSGVCFTYASLFAMRSLELVGQTWQTSEPVRRCCKEHYTSCEVEEYVQHERSQVVNTAWACWALMHARYPFKEAVEKGLKLIMSRQQANGEWYQEGVEGVFNNTCMIGYPNYKLYFTSWALGRYQHVYLPMLKEMEGL
ncbi:terpene synthase [Aspergillus heteromorphus CBS 117.55]|uniref:Terpene cyclase/mutase family member n=1 Tax=Aspergillus heteromorphus CBS 117.55 TaxID=1448321 RepID=A0A317VGI4_9EURO|nr:terpene synthase [Aspergillus heteromorphus CBS 117.55]PWY72257.1 terpene synthase [Aspergillus heteromorphus CBS 117.55]